MKFVLRINPKTLKQESCPYLEPGPVPPIVDPEDPEEPKDGGVPRSDENPGRPSEQKPS
jgi:hypothetical protein